MSQNRAAELTGVAQTNIGRWLRGDTGAPRAENVIMFAKALGHDPLEALVAAGYLEPADLQGAVTIHSPLTEVTDTELAGEIQRRLVGYNDVVEEMKRRYAADDPRRIEPGSPDVFPPFGGNRNRRSRAT